MDDTDLIESNSNATTATEAWHSLQKAVVTWEGGLKATCGALVPEKTFWYLIDFKWIAGSWYYHTIDECPASIVINDIEGDRKELRRCDVGDAQETLGIFLAPNGNTKQQQIKMLTSAIKWADCMRTGMIPRDDAWLAFQSTIWKTLSYPLPALNLTKEECEKILAPALHYLLPAVGVCRNYPRALVFISEKYMGLGIKHMHTTQELLRLKDIITHIFQHSNTGKLYKTSWETFFIELGLGTDLNHIPTDAIQALATDSLVKSTFLFLKAHHWSLQHDIQTPPL